MKIQFEGEVFSENSYVEGVEFDVRNGKVYVKIEDRYVALNKSDLKRALVAIVE